MFLYWINQNLNSWLEWKLWANVKILWVAEGAQNVQCVLCLGQGCSKSSFRRCSQLEKFTIHYISRHLCPCITQKGQKTRSWMFRWYGKQIGAQLNTNGDISDKNTLQDMRNIFLEYEKYQVFFWKKHSLKLAFQKNICFKKYVFVKYAFRNYAFRKCNFWKYVCFWKIQFWKKTLKE